MLHLNATNQATAQRGEDVYKVLILDSVTQVSVGRPRWATGALCMGWG